MKTKLLVLFSILSISICFAQEEFSMTLHFEAANGETDNLIVGYDVNATQGVDEVFGEMDYGTPISSSGFQVFAINYETFPADEAQNYFFKKQIVKKAEWQKIVAVLVPYDAFPVTVTWDNSQFDNSDRKYSVITDWDPLGWFDVGMSCTTALQEMRDVNSIVFPERFDTGEYGCFFEFPSGEGNTQKFHLIYVGFLTCEERHPCSFPPFCYCDLVDNITDINIDDNVSLVSIYSISGKDFSSFKKSNVKGTLDALPQGMYIILTENQEHQQKYSKFVKY